MNSLLDINYKSSSLFAIQTTLFKEYLFNLSNYGIMGKMPPLSKDLWEAINSIFSSFNIKLNLITETKYVDHVTWWYKLNPLNEQDINFYLPLLVLELSIYPKSFIKKLSLQQIIVCHSLSFHTDLYDQYRAAIPDYENPIYGMIYCAKERDISYIRSVIHHELFHYYDYIDHGGFVLQNDPWELFNPEGFKYGEGGWANRTVNTLDVKLFDYFISDYSTSGIEEDKAEIFGWMVTQGLSSKILGRREGVLGKYTSIKCMLENFDKEGFWQGNGDFWDKAIQFKKIICDNFYGIT